MTELLKNKLGEIFGDEIIRDLDFSSVKNKKDMISSIYEQITDRKLRKEFGQFFTHKELVEFIVDNLPISAETTILDPACGAGAFLIEALKRNTGNISNIYGIDIDPVAVELSKLNIEVFSGKKIIENIVNANTIKDFNFQKNFPKIYTDGGFDIIIGNPPFQNLRKNVDYNEKESIYSEVINNVVNSATLMLAKGFEFLKEEGHLGFVLPKNLVRVDSFAMIRDFLIENTFIQQIFDVNHYFKDVRGDQIVLIFQKRKLSTVEMKGLKTKISILDKNGDINNPYSYYSPQSDFRKYSFFPIFYREEIKQLTDKLLSIPETLEKVTKGQIFRGINLSVNHKAISKEKSEKSFITYRGDSIKKFGIKYPIYLNPLLLDKIVRKIGVLQKDKVILQNIFSREGGITATCSNKNELNIDTVTNVLSDDLDLKFILGIMNSNLANFFMIFIIFLVSNFTMHMDKKYIGRLPIIIPEEREIKEVINLVDKLLELEEKNSQEYFSLFEQLNRKIYSIYKLDNSEIELIEQLLRQVMSKRHFNG